jgi:hypothetical protein
MLTDIQPVLVYRYDGQKLWSGGAGYNPKRFHWIGPTRIELEQPEQ